MRAMHQANTIKLKARKAILLGTSALVCLALAAPVMARDIVITSGTTTNNSGGSLNGNDTANVTGTLDTGTTDSEHGILASDDDNKITVSNEGHIITGGENAHGIYHTGDNNETTVLGSITTTGADNAYGIYNVGDKNKTTVSGSITTGVVGTNAGEDSTGIWNYGNDNTTTLTSTGVITVNGPLADGIYNSNDKNITIVHGSIFVNGNGVSNDYAEGITNYGDDNETTLSGSITTTGNYAMGIANYGDDNTTSISGTVKSTGAKSGALYNYSGDGNSFTLNEGATIIGDILAVDETNPRNDATNSKLIFNLGASTSYAYSVSGKGVGTGAGQWTFSDQDGRTQGVTTDGTGCDTTIYGAGNDTCNLVTGAGIGNAEVQNELQYITNSALIGSLQFGSAVATSEDAAPSQDMWAKAYGVSSELKTTTAIAFDASTAGLTIGKPIVMGDDLDLDLVFNISSTDLDVGKTGDQSITAQGINFGVVLKDLAPNSGWDINAFGFVGKNSYDGTRKVMNNQQETGSETVTSSFSGTEVLVGVDAGYTKAMSKGLSFTSNVNATLSNESIGAYSESKYFTWGARKTTQVAGGVSVGLMHKRDALTTFVTLGADFSSLLSGKTATYTNQGTAATHTDSETDDTYGTLTVGFNYKSKNGASFVGAINASSSNNGLTSTAANLGLNWTF